MIAKNNPLNIRYNKNTKWLGQTGQRKGFVEFDTLEHGYRAALWLIKRTYMCRYGLDNVRSIISRFAPPSENDTKKYVHRVCIALSLLPDQRLCFIDVCNLVSIMAVVETGSIISSHTLYLIYQKYKI